MSLSNDKNIPAKLRKLEAELESLQLEENSYPDEQLGIMVCKQAIMAIRDMNYGVGCLLLDPKGAIVEQGRNQVFYPYFRSDRHAEMVVLNSFEDSNPQITTMKDYTLFASIEPCPMCVSRIVMSGIGKTKYLAKDPSGGMAKRIDELPQNFIRLSQKKIFEIADCSSRLSHLAWKIFTLNLYEMRSMLLKR